MILPRPKPLLDPFDQGLDQLVNREIGVFGPRHSGNLGARGIASMEAWQRPDALDLAMGQTIKSITAYAIHGELYTGRARIENEHDVLARIDLAGQLRPVLQRRGANAPNGVTNSFLCLQPPCGSPAI